MWGDCIGKQCRQQWVVIHCEDTNDRQTDDTQHKTHLEGTDNGKTVPQIADCEGHWMVRRHVQRQKFS